MALDARCWKPVYCGGVEVPVFRRFFPDGVIRFYGTRVIEAETRDGTIMMRLTVKVAVNGAVSVPFPPDKSEGLEMLRKVSEVCKPVAGQAGGHADLADYTHILEYLTVQQYPDGSPRETSALVVVADAVCWRVCLSDKDNGRVMWKTGDTLAGTLMSIEMSLIEEDNSAWRQAGGAKQKKKK